MTSRLKGKVAVITGAARGLGAATAILFAQEGANVVVNDVDSDGGKRIADRINTAGGRAIFVRANVSESPDVQHLIEETISTFLRIDILVNNAAIEGFGSWHELSEEKWDRVIAVNLKGPWLCSKYAIREMLKQNGGNIIFIGSQMAFFGSHNAGVYNIAKAGLVSMTKGIAWAYGSKNIRANILCPGPLETEMQMGSAARHPNPEQWISKTKRRTPLQRYATPEEMAYKVLFLASDESSYMDGASLVVDGGESAGIVTFQPPYMDEEFPQ